MFDFSHKFNLCMRTLLQTNLSTRGEDDRLIICTSLQIITCNEAEVVDHRNNTEKSMIKSAQDDREQFRSTATHLIGGRDKACNHPKIQQLLGLKVASRPNRSALREHKPTTENIHAKKAQHSRPNIQLQQRMRLIRAIYNSTPQTVFKSAA